MGFINEINICLPLDGYKHECLIGVSGGFVAIDFLLLLRSYTSKIYDIYLKRIE